MALPPASSQGHSPLGNFPHHSELRQVPIRGVLKSSGSPTALYSVGLVSPMGFQLQERGSSLCISGILYLLLGKQHEEWAMVAQMGPCEQVALH